MKDFCFICSVRVKHRRIRIFSNRFPFFHFDKISAPLPSNYLQGCQKHFFPFCKRFWGNFKNDLNWDIIFETNYPLPLIQTKPNITSKLILMKNLSNKYLKFPTILSFHLQHYILNFPKCWVLPHYPTPPGLHFITLISGSTFRINDTLKFSTISIFWNLRPFERSFLQNSFNFFEYFFVLKF